MATDIFDGALLEDQSKIELWKAGGGGGVGIGLAVSGDGRKGCQSAASLVPRPSSHRPPGTAPGGLPQATGDCCTVPPRQYKAPIARRSSLTQNAQVSAAGRRRSSSPLTDLCLALKSISTMTRPPLEDWCGSRTLRPSKRAGEGEGFRAVSDGTWVRRARALCRGSLSLRPVLRGGRLGCVAMFRCTCMPVEMKCVFLPQRDQWVTGWGYAE